VAELHNATSRCLGHATCRLLSCPCRPIILNPREMPNVLTQRFRSSQMSRSASLDGAHPTNSDEMPHCCGETSKHTFGAQPASDVISSIDDEANATQADAEHAVDAPAASGSDACASAVSDILQLRDVLGDMTLSQLRALAASWGGGLPSSSYDHRAGATCHMYDTHELSRTPNPSELICLALKNSRTPAPVLCL